MNPFQHSTHLQQLLDRLGQGDVLARDALVQRSFERLRLLARRALRRNLDARTAVETDDVLQGAAVRLHRSLTEVHPSTVGAFFRLASVQIRRELLDLIRRFRGTGGAKARLVTFVASEEGSALDAQADLASREPADAEGWTRFHEAAGALPDEEREVFDLVWYGGHSQPEAAHLLNISLRTVKRRWRSAQLLLYKSLQGEKPGA